MFSGLLPPVDTCNSITRHLIVPKAIQTLKRLGKSSTRNEKKFGFRFFCWWRHKCGRFRLFWLGFSDPELQPQKGSISLKVLLETRQKSEPYGPLISFLVFLVQKLW